MLDFKSSVHFINCRQNKNIFAKNNFLTVTHFVHQLFLFFRDIFRCFDKLTLLRESGEILVRIKMYRRRLLSMNERVFGFPLFRFKTDILKCKD